MYLTAFVLGLVISASLTLRLCSVAQICFMLLQMGIANRDIKLENTLLMDESERPLLKLCDFGYSKDEYQGSACKTLCGELQPHHNSWFAWAVVRIATIMRCLG